MPHWIVAPYDLFNWVTDQLFLLMNALFERFGTPVVFAAALAEATVLVGVVFPGTILIFLGGAYASAHGTSVGVVFVVGTVGTILGDTLSYALGRYGLARLAGTRWAPTLRLGLALMTGRGRWLIPFYHLNSITRALGPFGAGVVRLPLPVWLPLDYGGAALANAAWVGAGAILGRAVLTADGRLQEAPALRLGLIAAAAAWLWFMAREVRRTARLTREADGQHASVTPELDPPPSVPPASDVPA